MNLSYNELTVLVDNMNINDVISVQNGELTTLYQEQYMFPMNDFIGNNILDEDNESQNMNE